MNTNRNKRNDFFCAFFLLTMAVITSVSCRAQIASESSAQAKNENLVVQNCEQLKTEPNEPPVWKENALHQAVFDLNIKKVKKLLAEKAAVDELAAYGDTALILSLKPRISEAKPLSAERRGRELENEMNFRLEAVRELLKYKADANKKGSGGTTPLIEIARRNYKAAHQSALLDLLLESKADVNLTDERGMTPLITAAENGNTEAVKFLLAHGANRDLKNCAGQTALSIARSNNEIEIVQLLEASN